MKSRQIPQSNIFCIFTSLDRWCTVIIVLVHHPKPLRKNCCSTWKAKEPTHHPQHKKLPRASEGFWSKRSQRKATARKIAYIGLIFFFFLWFLFLLFYYSSCSGYFFLIFCVLSFFFFVPFFFFFFLFFFSFCSSSIFGSASLNLFLPHLLLILLFLALIFLLVGIIILLLLVLLLLSLFSPSSFYFPYLLLLLLFSSSSSFFFLFLVISSFLIFLCFLLLCFFYFCCFFFFPVYTSKHYNKMGFTGEPPNKKISKQKWSNFGDRKKSYLLPVFALLEVTITGHCNDFVEKLDLDSFEIWKTERSRAPNTTKNRGFRRCSDFCHEVEKKGQKIGPNLDCTKKRPFLWWAEFLQGVFFVHFWLLLCARGFRVRNTRNKGVS